MTFAYLSSPAAAVKRKAQRADGLLSMSGLRGHNRRAALRQKKAPTTRGVACSPFVKARVSRVAPPGEQGLIEKAQRGPRGASPLLADHYWDRLYRWLYH